MGPLRFPPIWLCRAVQALRKELERLGWASGLAATLPCLSALGLFDCEGHEANAQAARGFPNTQGHQICEIHRS